MKRSIHILLLLVYAFAMKAQKEKYELNKPPFSTPVYDEFSPVFYEDGIVYSSNKKHDVLITYKGAENNLPLNLYYVQKSDSVSWEKASLFQRFFSSALHDGPATFTADFENIIYSRNIEAGVKFKDVVNPNNKLGLFMSEKVDGKWNQPRPFPYNSNDYSLTTPAYDPQGQFVIFTSDMPGGFGGSDLYISRKSEGGSWLMPENLGAGINTHSSEAYPFLNKKGDLYFSSNGYDGHGGKDLLVAYKMESGWSKPVLLDAPLNSKYDDISICADDYLEAGFISSNRENTDDIFEFHARSYPFMDCNMQKEGQYCFLFTDENSSENTTPFTKYQWEFSDGTIKDGVEVKHCFAGPGHYSVKLNLIDEVTGNVFFTKSAFEFDIEKHVQPYIDVLDVATVEDVLDMNAVQSNLPGIDLERYYWEFGDGDLSIHPKEKHKYPEAGEYFIQLGVIGTDSLGQRSEHCVRKQISIFADNQELVEKRGYQRILENLPSEGDIDSINGDRLFDPTTDAYCFGFNFAKLSPSENMELNSKLEKIDFNWIRFNDSLPIERNQHLLDTIANILNEFPNVKVEIALHTDPSWEAVDGMNHTRARAEGIRKLLEKKGVSRSRLETKAYGSSRPFKISMAGNRPDIKMNNRIEFIVLRNHALSSGNSLLD